jgi:hypothetical protein
MITKDPIVFGLKVSPIGEPTNAYYALPVFLTHDILVLTEKSGF